MDQRSFDQHTPSTPSGRTRALVFAAMLVFGALWVTVRHPLEGPTIYEFSENHGVHLLDLPALIPPVLALWWWARSSG